MKKSLFYLLILSALVLSSCKKDNEESNPELCATSWAVSIQDEANAFATAYMAYATSQSVANCQAYKAALQAYINAMKPYGTCSALTGTSKQEWQESLNDAQEQVNELTCQ